MRAGIPVVNLDRIFNTPQAYRCWIGGDNYGMGLNAGHYIGEKLKDKPNAKVIELAGLDNLELTKQRTQGFDDALKNYPNIKKVARQAAEFTVESGQAKMAQLLQAQPEVRRPVEPRRRPGRGRAAGHRAGRPRRLPHGRRRGRPLRVPGHQAGQQRPEGHGRSTRRRMAASAIDLARALGQGKGVSGLSEFEIPVVATLYSAVVDKDNVDQYMPTGFKCTISAASGRRRAGRLRDQPRRPAADHGSPHDHEEDLRMAQPQADAAEADTPALGVGMVGYAFMGAAHSQGWRTVGRVFDLPLRPVLAAICGRDAGAVRAAAEQHGWAAAETDWRALIERDDVDLVDICTPGDSHAEIALAALAAGKHVLCEKPLANTVEEAEAMTAAAEEAERRGQLAMVGFNYRRRARHRARPFHGRRGQARRLRHVRVTYLQDWLVDPEFPLTWRLRKETAGSGALGDLGAHIVDLAQYLVGEPLAGVSALTEPSYGNARCPAARPAA